MLVYQHERRRAADVIAIRERAPARRVDIDANDARIELTACRCQLLDHRPHAPTYRAIARAELQELRPVRGHNRWPFVRAHIAERAGMPCPGGFARLLRLCGRHV